MKTLNLGIAMGGIIIALIFTPIFVQAGALTASDAAGSNFKPATMKAQTIKPADAGTPGATAATPGFAPVYTMPAAPTGAAPMTGPFAPAPQQTANLVNKKSTRNEALQQLINAWTAGGPNANTNWDTYNYPKGYRGWNSGDIGAEDIGNGLCNKKNENRTQMKEGYCKILSDLLNEKGSCANRAMETILRDAENNRIGTFEEYCKDYSSLDKETKTDVFVQILSGLITKESGWNAHATEQPWVREDNNHMGGLGLFQIGVDDKNKDDDCNGLNNQSIMDAKTNIRCGACIALKYVAADKHIGHGHNDKDEAGNRTSFGMAAYFAPFRDHNENPKANKRGEIKAATQSYCQAAASGGEKSSYLAARSAPAAPPVKDVAAATPTVDAAPARSPGAAAK